VTVSDTNPSKKMIQPRHGSSVDSVTVVETVIIPKDLQDASK
jgi:hypothetical protein